MTNTLVATSFGAPSTTDDVLSGVRLKGKRILVTLSLIHIWPAASMKTL